MMWFAAYTQVSGKKETKMFVIISPTELELVGQNLVYSLLNKFGTKSFKRFPPHLNSVSTQPCETWHAHRARATTELSEKVTP